MSGPTSINDIPELPANTEARADPSGDLRDEAFKDLATLGAQLDSVDEDNLSDTGRLRLQHQRAALLEEEKKARLQSVEPLVAEIARNPDAKIGAKINAIQTINSSAVYGAHPENIAFEEILHQENQNLETEIEKTTQARVADQLSDNHDIQTQLTIALEEIERATDPTIPFVETGVEFITGPMMGFLIDDTWNLNAMIEASFPNIRDFGLDVSAKDNIIAANAALNRMSKEEKLEVLGKMKDHALSKSGLFLDNGWTADSYNAAIQAIFGSRMEALIFADENAFNQLFGVMTSYSVAKATQLGGRAIKAGSTVAKASNKASKSTSKVSPADEATTVARGLQDGDVPVDNLTPNTELGTTTARGLDEAPVPTQPAPPGSSLDDLRTFVAGGKVTPGIRVQVTKDYAPDSAVPATTVTSMISKTAPSLSKDIIRGALKDQELARKLGTNQLDLAHDHLQWITPGQPVRRGPNVIEYSVSGTVRSIPRAAANNSDDAADAVFHDFKSTVPESLRGYISNRDLVKETEVTRAVTELGQKFDDQDTLSIKKVRVNDDTDEGISADYILSKSSGMAFDSIEELEIYAARQLDDDDFHRKIPLGYDPVTNTYRAGIEDAPEYLLQVSYLRTRSAIAEKENLFRLNSNGDLKLGFASRLTNSFDSTITYIERFARGITRASHTIGLVGDKMRTDLAPLNSLNSNSRHAVWRVLREENAKAFEYTRPELIKKLSPEERRGYYAVRRQVRNTWGIRNWVYRETLARAGYKSLSISGQPDAYVRNINDQIDDVETVWLASEGRIVDRAYLDEAGLDNLDFFESHLLRKSDDGAEATPYIAMDKGSAKLDELPGEVLVKRPGYLDQDIQTKFVVYKPESIRINGKVSPGTGDVVRVSDNAVEAQEYAQAHGLKVRVAKEVADTDVSGKLLNEIQNLGELGMLNHSYARTDLHKLHLSTKQAMKTPEEAMEDSITASARTVGTSELINYSINKFMRTYGKPLNIQSFDWGIKVRAPNTDVELKKLAQQANIAKRKIEHIAGFSNSQINRSMREAALMLSNQIAETAIKRDGKGKSSRIHKAVSNAASALSRDWISDVSRVNFVRLIGLMPTRQVIQNVGMTFMYSGVKHGSEYMLGRGVADLATISAMKLSENSPKLFKAEAETWAKLTGNKPEDIIEIFDDLTKSGVMNISDHQFFESTRRSALSLRNHAGNSVEDGPRKIDPIGTIARTGKLGLQGITKIGFEGSEQFNKMTAFLIMRNRAVKEGEYDGNFNKIAEDASILAGNMGQVNKAAFQVGNWRAITQFQSHTIKMMQYMVSDVPGLDPATKRRMLVWHTAAFGTRGLGFGGATMTAYHQFLKDSAEDEGISLEPAHIKIFTDGLSSYAYNRALEGLFGLESGESQVNFSGVAAPLSGTFSELGFLHYPTLSDTTGKIQWKPIPVDGGAQTNSLLTTGIKLGLDIVTRSDVDWGEYIGVSDSLISAGVDWVDDVQKIGRAEGFTIDEKGEALLMSTLDLLPLFNNVTQSRIMMATGNHADKYGNPIVRATVADAFSRALFGARDDSIDKYYKLRADTQAQLSLEEGNDRHWQSTGRDLADATMFVMRQLNDGEIPHDQFIDKMHALSSYIKLGYGEHQHASKVIWSAALKRLNDTRDKNNTTAYDTLAEAILTDDELQGELGLDNLRRKLKEIQGKDSIFLQAELDRIEHNSGFK